MPESPFIVSDNTQRANARYCPLIQGPCKSEGCQWWVADYMEAKGATRVNCAVVIIAQGVTDEALVGHRR